MYAVTLLTVEQESVSMIDTKRRVERWVCSFKTKTLWNYLSFPIIKRGLSPSSNKTIHVPFAYLNSFSYAESREERRKEREKEEGGKKCRCLVNAITFRFRRVDFWWRGGEKPAFELSCYEHRNKKKRNESTTSMRPVIKVKVAFRVIIVIPKERRNEFCCLSVRFESARVNAWYWRDIGLACSSRLTNPRRIMIRWMERACNLPLK